jgi:hypothetical protein
MEMSITTHHAPHGVAPSDKYNCSTDEEMAFWNNKVISMAITIRIAVSSQLREP